MGQQQQNMDRILHNIQMVTNLIFLHLFLIYLPLSTCTLAGPYLRGSPPSSHPALILTQADRDIDQFLRQNYRQLSNSTLFVNRNSNYNYLFIYRQNKNASLFVFDSDYNHTGNTLKINGVLELTGLEGSQSLAMLKPTTQVSQVFDLLKNSAGRANTSLLVNPVPPKPRSFLEQWANYDFVQKLGDDKSPNQKKGRN